MAFAGRFGGLVRQGLYKNSASNVASMASMLSAVRDMSSKLFIGGLSWGTDDQSLKDAFSTYGEIVEVVADVKLSHNNALMICEMRIGESSK